MSLTESIVEEADLTWFGELGYAVGGIIIRIIRPGLTPMNHESETEQKYIIADYTLINDEELEEELEALYEREMGSV